MAATAPETMYSIPVRFRGSMNSAMRSGSDTTEDRADRLLHLLLAPGRIPLPDAGGTVVIGKPLFDMFAPEGSDPVSPHLPAERLRSPTIPWETNSV